MCILLDCEKSNSLTVKIYYTVGTGRRKDSAEPLDFNVIVPRSKQSFRRNKGLCMFIVSKSQKGSIFSPPPILI